MDRVDFATTVKPFNSTGPNPTGHYIEFYGAIITPTLPNLTLNKHEKHIEIRDVRGDVVKSTWPKT